MRAMAVSPRCQPAPPHHTTVYPALLEQKSLRLVAQPRTLEEAGIAQGVKRLQRRDGRRRLRLVFFHYYVGGISQPTASVWKVLVQMTHHEVDGAAMCVAGEATVSVTSHVECQAGMMVVMEGAEALVPRHTQPQPLRHPLHGQLAELLYSFSIHIFK